MLFCSRENKWDVCRFVFHFKKPPRVAEGLWAITRYQRRLFGMRHATPKAINWSKSYEVKQEPNESPPAFMERVKNTARKYTNVDPERRLGNWPLFLWDNLPRMYTRNSKS